MNLLLYRPFKTILSGHSALLFLILFLFNHPVKLLSQGDSCTSATVLSNVTNYCSGATQYTNVGATKNATGYALPGCWSTGFGNPTEDVWFSFTAIGSDVFITIKGTGNGGATIKQPRIALYIGPCAPTITELGCTDGTQFSPGNGLSQLYVGGLVLGTTYLIRVSTSQADEGTFQLCINNYTPPNNPGADCGGASILCNKDPITVPKLSGPGLDNDEPEPGSCMDVPLTDETNSCWYTFTCKTSGTLTMDIIPTTPTDDIDFTFYELVGTDVCSTSGATKRKVRRCAGAACVATTNGKTGMNMTANDSSEAQSLTMPYCTGNIDAYVKYLDLVAGRSYAILINNANANGSFSINWGGTSTFMGPTAIITTTATTICAGQTVTFDGSTSTNYTTLKWSFVSGGSPTTATGIGPHTVTYNTAGNYVAILEATNAQGCKTVETVNITVNPMSVITVPPATICEDESATLTASGATSYSWTPATGLSATTGASVIASPGTTTTYTVTGSAPGSCSVTASVIVTVNPKPVLNVSPTTICKGDSIPLTASGASTYSWSPATGLTTTTGATVIAHPGSTTTYTVTGTSADGCTESTTVVLTVNPVCGVVLIASDATVCEGACATLTTTVTGGTPPFSYSWNTGETTADLTPAICPTVTTTYTVIVTDNSNPVTTDTTTAVITVNPKPIVTVPPAAICEGNATPLTASGATDFTWAPATGLNNTTGTTVTANPTTTTTYTVTGSQPTGCTGTTTVVVTVNPVPVVSVPDASVCPGGATTLNASGAADYTWTPATGLSATTGSSVTASPAATSTYTVCGSDKGCSSCTTVIVTVGMPVANAGPDVVICPGDSILLGATGGTAYTWSPATGLSNTTIANPVARPAVTTTYTVTATSGNCSATDAVIVTVNTPIVLDAAGVDMSCNGICNGQTIVIPTGGTAPYTYNWNSGCTAAACNNVCAGTYTITVTDVIGCSATSTATVNEPPALTANITGFTSASCNGVCDGSATVSANGGTIPYTYSWNTSPVQNTASASGLCAATYTCTVSDNNNCTVITSLTIIQPSPVVLAPVAPVTICTGKSALLTTTALGGTPAYNYNWMPAGTGTTAFVSVSPATTTTYTVSATDANGCTAIPVIAVVKVNPPLTVNANGSTAICPGGSAKLTATAGGGDGSDGGSYSYSWSPGGETTSAIIVSPLVTTVYTITISDGCGTAPVSDTLTITVSPVPTIAFGANITSGCAPVCVNFTDSSIITSGSIVSWAWDFNDAPASALQHPSHCFNSPGKYSITLTATSDKGCKSTFTNTNMINVYANPIAAFDPTPNPATILDPNITMNDQSTPDVNSWYWSFGDGDSLAPNVPNPIHSYPKDVQEKYTVTLIVSNANGCYDKASREIIIGPIATFYIPNAFTPNNDGINDAFYGKGEGIIKYDMWIFDRWGELIFHTTELSESWDGKANGGSKVAQQDVYVWKVRLTDILNKKHDYIGTVTLVR